MCIKCGFKIFLDLKQEFRNVMRGGLPVLSLKSEKDIGKSFDHKLLINSGKIKTEILKSNLTQDKQFFKKSNFTENWKLLYQQFTPAILYAAVINNHPQELQ